jgi:hypothetical protein
MIKTSEVLSRKVAQVAPPSPERQRELLAMIEQQKRLPPRDASYTPKVKPGKVDLEKSLGSNLGNENNRTFAKLFGTDPAPKK